MEQILYQLFWIKWSKFTTEVNFLFVLNTRIDSEYASVLNNKIPYFNRPDKNNIILKYANNGVTYAAKEKRCLLNFQCFINLCAAWVSILLPFYLEKV